MSHINCTMGRKVIRFLCKSTFVNIPLRTVNLFLLYLLVLILIGGLSLSMYTYRLRFDSSENTQIPPYRNTAISHHVRHGERRISRSETDGNIKPVPKSSASDFVDSLPHSVMNKYLHYEKREYTESVVILTPIHDVADKLQTFMKMLTSLTYPRSLISIAFGEDCSKDDTLTQANVVARELRKTFKRVEVFHFNITGQISGSWSQIHHILSQFPRRRHIAQSRNLLMKAGLKSETWALWIDSDISHLPRDIIQQLLSSKKDIVVPACLYNESGRLRIFDKNTWRETPMSMLKQERLREDVLMLEGYGPSSRIFLTDLRAEGRVVPIDGVGGCTLLVRGDYHRNGLIFPESIIDHHIETEGLAKLAKRKGYTVYGMPFVEVLH